MASIRVETLREKYPGLTDKEIAAAYAKEQGYHVVLRYKASGPDISPASEYTDFAVCVLQAEVDGYFSSPFCSDIEILYDDGRRGHRW